MPTPNEFNQSSSPVGKPFDINKVQPLDNNWRPNGPFTERLQIEELPVVNAFPDPLKTPEVPIEPSRIQIQFEEIEFGEHGVVGDVMKTLKSQEAMLTALLLAYIYDIVTNVAALAGNQVDVVDVVLGIFVGFSEYFLHGINHFYERTSNERMNEKRFLMATKVILLAMIVADFAFSIKPITDHYSQETDSTVQIGIGITAIVVSALTTVAQMKLPEQIAIVRSAQNYKRRKL